MLKTENRCLFSITSPYAGIKETRGVYGYILDFTQDDAQYQGVLAPHMRGGPSGVTEWVLFPMWCVTITEQPKEPVRGPAYEVDE